MLIKKINTVIKFIFLHYFFLSTLSYAQCGVTMSCNGPPTVCDVHACFRNEAVKKKYEKENNCKFSNKGFCDDKPLNDATECCVKDSKSGDAKILNKQITRINPDFNWATYQRECTNMRQSEAPADALWAQCVVGQRHSINDNWTITEVIKNSKARTYCIDGCSTPPDAVEAAFRAEIFLVRNKDNPSGFPTASFYNACKAHDICYQTCNNTSQNGCDRNLLNSSRQACATIPRENTTRVTTFGWPHDENTRDKCNLAANRMFTVLSQLNFGAAAFHLRRQQMCQCC